MPNVEPDLLIMQPAHALEFNTTYIVAVRNLYEDDGDNVVRKIASGSPAFLNSPGSAARFKAAVRALKHTMGPAAKELNEAAERLEKLAVDRSEL